MDAPMRDAGFKRRGPRSYEIASAEGNLVLVSVRGYTPIPHLSFSIEWAAIPRALVDFQRSHSGGQPKLDWGVIYTRLLVPPEWRHSPYNDDLWWLHSDDDLARLGEKLHEILVRDAIPMWLRLLDREELAGAGWTDFTQSNFSGWDGAALRRAILYVDDGDPEEVRRYLDAAVIERQGSERLPLIDWLRRRLASRIGT